MPLCLLMIGNLGFGDGARLKLRQSFATSGADAIELYYGCDLKLSRGQNLKLDLGKHKLGRGTII